MPIFPLHGQGQVRSFRMPADFWLRRAQRCREQNQPLRAVTILRHASRQEPDVSALQLEYAQQLHMLSCYEASNRECFDLLSRHSACFAAFGLIAENMVAMGRLGEGSDAYAIYAQYAQLYPDNVPEWDEEIYDVEDTLMSQPAAPRHLRLSALLKYAGQHIQRGDQAGAEKLLRRSMQPPYPIDLPQRDALLALYQHQFGSPPQAKAYALNVVHSAPHTVGLLLPMALLLRQLHSPSAIPALMLAAIAASTAADELGVCVAAVELNCPAIAIAMLERALKREPHRMSAVYNLCVLKLRQGSISGVSASAHRLREIDPDDPAAESLFAVVTHLEETSASPAQIAEAGAAQPFYGIPDERVDGRNLEECCAALKDGVEAFAQAISTDKRLYERFISLFRLEGNLYTLLPALCAAMKPEASLMLLRRLLLADVTDERTLQTVCWLMKEQGQHPPFLIHANQRITPVDLDETPAPSPTLMQRLLFRRLSGVCRACGRAALPFALHAIAGMPPDRRRQLAGDRLKVWIPAFRTAYAHATGAPLPSLSGGLLTPPRWQAYRQALRALKPLK